MATTTKVFNIAGGKHSAEAYSSFEGLLYGSCVASGLTISKSSSNMNCFINSGAGLIKVGSTYARRFAIEGGTLTVTVSAASTTLARRDTIVLYVDNSVTPTTSVEDNTNNILKGMVVAGTPAQNPTAPNATAIQSAVGAGNPYIILYDILVPANATNLSTATLYDRRVMASKALVDALPSGAIPAAAIADSAVTTAKINNNAVSTAKIDWTSIIGTVSEGSPVSSGYIDLGTVRIQWKNNRFSTLNTSAGSYNGINDAFPAPFASTNYAVIVSETSDTSNVAGGNFKVVSKTTTGVSLNYNHTGAIGSSTLNYSIFAIGLKP